MNREEDEALEREFDMLMARSGIAVPVDWRSGAMVGYRDLKRLAMLLRRPRVAESEPSNVYRLSTIIPGRGP